MIETANSGHQSGLMQLADAERWLADISRLPQFGVVQQSDAERWVAGIQRYHASSAAWHAKRLLGIGGSEIGAVIRGVKDLKESGFSTHKRVVQDKLMKRLPEFQNDHMKRGTVLEMLARLAFTYRYKAEQDIRAMQAMNSGAPRPGYEWLVGNADDISLLNNKRFMNDYKVPSCYSEDIEFDYNAQVHHYALKARFAGVKLDGLLITKLDLAPELAKSLTDRIHQMSNEDLHDLAKTIARTNVPGMRVVSHVVEMSRDMDLDILECGGYLWNDFVLAGVVPEIEPKPQIELPDEKLLEIGRFQQQYAIAKAGIKYLTSVSKAASDSITESLAGVEIADKAMPLGLVKITPKGPDSTRLVEEALKFGATDEELLSSKKDYSIVALIEEIKRLNGDPESNHLFTQSKDPIKAEAYLIEKGVDISSLKTGEIAIAMSTKKEHAKIGQVYESAARGVFMDWVDMHTISGEAVADHLEEFADGLDASGIDALEAASGTLSELFADKPVNHANDDLSQIKHPLKHGAAMR